MSNINTPDSKPSTITVPVNYPMVPQPGKISILFESNKNDLYHKFSPLSYAGGSVFGSEQPYIYKYPDEVTNVLSTVENTADDVKRVTSFIGSSFGTSFIEKQTMLQGFQAFDETTTYNPSEIVNSVVSNLTEGITETTKRYVNKTGELLGGIASLVGVSISKGEAPPSTVASDRETEVLPIQSFGDAVGMLRAKTANKARSILQQKLGAVGEQTEDFVNGLASSIFQQSSDKNKQDYEQRADDVAYEWMVKNYNNSTVQGMSGGDQSKGLYNGFMGNFLKKSSTTTTTKDDTNSELFKTKYYKDTNKETKLYNVDGAFYISKDNNKSELKQKFEDWGFNDGIKKLQDQKNSYFDTISWKPVDGKSSIDNAFKKYTENGKQVTSKDLTKEGTYTKTYDESNNSRWNTKFDNSNGYAANSRPVSDNSKLTDTTDADNPISQLNESLKRVISKISEGGYSVNFDNNDTWLLSSGNSSKQGYDRLHSDIKNGNLSGPGKGNAKNSNNSVESEYYNRNVRTLDASINPNKNYGFAASGRPDTLNTLTVLDKDKTVIAQLVSNYSQWKPYEDDLIAFFFYDIVNEKYIPFRCTVKNLSESNNASWDPLKFIGRADELYSYTGFSRQLSFSFTVVINSLVELWPTWQKISYLASCVKPANYTKKTQNDGVTNRFIVPPMLMLTIGDLFKYHPIVINTVTVNVPEGASWETVPENSTEDWSYMAKIIKSSKVSKDHIGQVPREIDIQIACNVLEKERAQMGGCHYGHAVKAQLTSNAEHLQYMEKWSKNVRTVKLADVDD